MKERRRKKCLNRLFARFENVQCKARNKNKTIWIGDDLILTMHVTHTYIECVCVCVLLAASQRTNLAFYFIDGDNTHRLEC